MEKALDIKTILEMSVEQVNLTNPEFQLSPEIHCDKDNVILFSSSLIDIYRILLNNVIKHSKLKPDKLVVKISTLKVEDFLIIKIINNLGKINLTKTKEKFSNIKNNWKSKDEDIVNQEGGTGFPKIKKIIRYEILAIDDEFDFDIKDNMISQEVKFRINFTKI